MEPSRASGTPCADKRRSLARALRMSVHPLTQITTSGLRLAGAQMFTDSSNPSRDHS